MDYEALDKDKLHVSEEEEMAARLHTLKVQANLLEEQVMRLRSNLDDAYEFYNALFTSQQEK